MLNLCQRLQYRKNRRYSGVAEDSPRDDRDFIYSAMTPMDDIISYPTNYTVSSKQYVSYNQESTPMCVAFAAKRLMEQLEAKEHRQYIPMSAGFIYKNRDLGDISLLLNYRGLIVREVIKHLYEDGVCPETIYDWRGNWRNLSWAQKHPSLHDSLYDFADKYSINAYMRLNSTEEIKHYLMTYDVGALVTIKVTPKFQGGYNENITESYAIQNSKSTHCMVIEGWHIHDGQEYWEVANSWGKDWGSNGYCYLPVGYPLKECWGVINRENEPAYYHVQFGPHLSKYKAIQMQYALVGLGYDTALVDIFDENSGIVKYYIQVGAFYSISDALALNRKLNEDTKVRALNGELRMIKY